MYGANSKKILRIYVSPFLKESAFFLFKRGNYPKELSSSIPKFLYFLKVLHQICMTPIEEIDDKDSFGTIKKDWYKKLPNKLVICTPHNEEIVIKKKGESEYSLETDILKMQDTVGPNTSDKGFLETGNLETFMKWIDSPDNYYGKLADNTGIIHVITHSNVMKNYIKSKISDSSKYNSFFKSNVWSFITSLNKTSISANEIKPGISQKIPDAKILENVFRNKYNSSLCGVKGSVKKLQSGGRKTRRKNSVRH
jgi:hypothetical protein